MDPRGAVPTIQCPRCGLAAEPGAGRGQLGMVVCKRCDLAYETSDGARAADNTTRQRPPRREEKGALVIQRDEDAVSMIFPAAQNRIMVWLSMAMTVMFVIFAHQLFRRDEVG